MYTIRSPYLLQKLFPNLIWKGKSSNSKLIYLSFDDGPHPHVTIEVLRILKEQQIKATFFCVGENVKKHPDIFQQIIEDGHKTGNHTFNHLNGFKTDTKSYIENVAKARQYIDTNLFRPPYGRITPFQSKILLKNNYKIVMWSLLSGDFDQQIDGKKCLENVVFNLKPNDIIVFHDSEKAQNTMLYALPRFIEYAKKNGYQFEHL